MYEENEPCGFGCAIAESGTKFRGTWLNGLMHGLCKNLSMISNNILLGIENTPEGDVSVCEYRNGKKNGKMTAYYDEM